MSEKTIRLRRKIDQTHWVGDGFHVSTLFHGEELAKLTSPFVLLDYAAPEFFEPTEKILGVGEHPHKGFETVTFCYAGEVSHKDSSGGGATIMPGDVQWMTAGKGVVHEEFLSKSFLEKGGELEMLQLWVNLPKKFKLTNPRYQDLDSDNFPLIELADTKVSLKLFAGELFGDKSPAMTHTPMTIFDLNFSGEAEVEIPLKPGTNTIVIGLRDGVFLDGQSLVQKEAAFFDRQGELLKVSGKSGGRCIVFNGEPIDEPMVSYGPFVMNTMDEIKEAYKEYRSGKMGHL